MFKEVRQSPHLESIFGNSLDMVPDTVAPKKAPQRTAKKSKKPLRRKTSKD